MTGTERHRVVQWIKEQVADVQEIVEHKRGWRFAVALEMPSARNPLSLSEQNPLSIAYVKMMYYARLIRVKPHMFGLIHFRIQPSNAYTVWYQRSIAALVVIKNERKYLMLNFVSFRKATVSVETKVAVSEFKPGAKRTYDKAKLYADHAMGVFFSNVFELSEKCCRYGCEIHGKPYYLFPLEPEEEPKTAA